MINKISTLPNYYNGKLYKRWDSVRQLYGDGTILASRTTKDNKVIQLMISDYGKKRELLYPNGKIMEISDNKFSKRTYVYKKINSDTIKGKMYHSAPLYGAKAPIIIFAKWLLRKLVPEKLFLKLNTDNPSANIFVPAEFLKQETNDFFGAGKRVLAKKVLACSFDNNNSECPLPKIIMMKSKDDNGVEIIDQLFGEDNIKISKQLGIYSEELGNNIRTIV